MPPPLTYLKSPRHRLRSPQHTPWRGRRPDANQHRDVGRQSERENPSFICYDDASPQSPRGFEDSAHVSRQKIVSTRSRSSTRRSSPHVVFRILLLQDHRLLSQPLLPLLFLPVLQGPVKEEGEGSSVEPPAAACPKAARCEKAAPGTPGEHAASRIRRTPGRPPPPSDPSTTGPAGCALWRWAVPSASFTASLNVALKCAELAPPAPLSSASGAFGHVQHG